MAPLSFKDKRFIACLMLLLLAPLILTNYLLSFREKEVPYVDVAVHTVPYHVEQLDESSAHNIIGYNADSDITYVRRNIFTDVVSGTIVELSDGSQYTVLDTTVDGFYLDVSEHKVSAGASGSPIWYNNQIIGYVSALSGNKKLYCVWEVS